MGKCSILSLDGGELPNLDLDVCLPLDLGDLRLPFGDLGDLLRLLDFDLRAIYCIVLYCKTFNYY